MLKSQWLSRHDLVTFYCCNLCNLFIYLPLFGVLLEVRFRLIFTDEQQGTWIPPTHNFFRIHCMNCGILHLFHLIIPQIVDKIVVHIKKSTNLPQFMDFWIQRTCGCKVHQVLCFCLWLSLSHQGFTAMLPWPDTVCAGMPYSVFWAVVLLLPPSQAPKPHSLLHLQTPSVALF